MQYVALLFAFSGTLVFSKLSPTFQEKPPLYFTPPAELLPHIVLGYKDFVAHWLWLRLIQSADFCSFEKGRPLYMGYLKTCELGWSYRITDAITTLAPRFKKPYTFSVVMLSIFAGDTKGAERILLKGLKHFPQDGQLNFYASYFYSFEKKDLKKSAFYAHLSAKNGGPKWLYNLPPKEGSNSPARSRLKKTVLKNLLKSGNLTHQQKARLKQTLKQ